MNFLVLDTSLLDRPEYISKADGFISYENDPDYQWDSEIHAPISWHSYAACMNGRFVCASPTNDWAKHVQWCDAALVLWNYNPKFSQEVIEKMRKAGKKVIGAFHENGDTLQHHARDLEWLLQFKHCANACDAILTYPRHKVHHALYQAMGIKVSLLHIIQPYHTARMIDFVLPAEEKEGIFVAPLKKDQEIERRNWLYNVLLAGQMTHDLTIVNAKNRITTINASTKYSNSQLLHYLEEVNPYVKWNIENPKPYKEYLKLIASHEYTVNSDSSDTQGQVDADSLFVGTNLLSLGMNYQTDFSDEYFLFRSEEYNTHWLKENETVQSSFMERCASMEVAKNQIMEWYERT